MSRGDWTEIGGKHSRPILLVGKGQEGFVLGMKERYDKEFKTKVTLEGLEDEKTLLGCAATYAVH